MSLHPYGEPSPTTPLEVTDLLTSPALGQLATALALAQAAIKGALTDSTNPHFKSKYADLSSVWEACRVALTANGLAVIQAPTTEGSLVRVTTRLVHGSGEWAQSTVACSVERPQPQPVGSAITYLRRYALAAMVGVAPEDDDAESATARKKGAEAPPAVDHFGLPVREADVPPTQLPPPPPPAPTPAAEVFPDATPVAIITEGQRRSLMAALRMGGHDREAAKRWLALEHGIESTKEIPVALFNLVQRRFADPTPL